MTRYPEVESIFIQETLQTPAEPACAPLDAALTEDPHPARRIHSNGMALGTANTIDLDTR